ncbi:hypothetical protein BHE74_00000202 [Ensete ventricosum]|nr:hypothetical protein GW17_00012443 [Ensete ventricosum]RWW90859.1 hypothetical protein BHE74_00000202 [Ensete ventricosum]RZS25712.1 hypothetical protein BHM03_00058954 [Ensete ventricosum]
MRFLQNLVPGCSKITGKAVMLDEIINYVKSLQQQVELLSMKLAAIHPEINLNVEQGLLKDVRLLWFCFLMTFLSPTSAEHLNLFLFLDLHLVLFI